MQVHITQKRLQHYGDNISTESGRKTQWHWQTPIRYNDNDNNHAATERIYKNVVHNHWDRQP
jgi:hypothetical protein